MEKAMLHTDGDWEELPLTECLALVSRGKAREATGESVSHYDDNLRTFLTIEEEGDDCTDCDAIVTADDPYYATPCGTYCSSCMRKHMVDCEICRNEFED